jgi:predicted membrane protein
MNTENVPPKSKSHLIGGIVVLVIGILFLLKSFDFFTPEMRHYIFSWKTLLIGIGLLNITLSKEQTSGFILVAIGMLFWMPEVLDLQIRTGQLIFPIIIIIIGLIIIFKRPGQRIPRHLRKNRRPWKHGVKEEFTPFTETNEPASDHATTGNPSQGTDEKRYKAYSDTEFVDDVAIFSGTSKRIVTNNFRGGSMTAIFGGSELNLTRSRLAPGKNYLNVFFMFGGSEIIVPSDWNIVLEATPIFGGFSDERYVSRPSSTLNENEPVLYIKGLVIFGGAEIKSY